MKASSRRLRHYTTSWGQLVPIIIALIFVPLLVRAIQIEIPAEHLVWAKGASEFFVDVFPYHKSGLFIFASLIALSLYIYAYVKHYTNLVDTKLDYLVYAYMVIVVLSTLFSSNFGLSIVGFKAHYENVFVLLGYMILFLYTSKIINDEKKLDRLLVFWFASTIIMFLIGLGQQFGFDLITSEFGQKFVKPSSMTTINLTGDNEVVRNVYQTLFHYNYVSFYAAIALPFALSMSIIEKDFKKRSMYIAMTLMMAINQVISLSRNGFFGIVVALFFVLILLRKPIFKFWKIVIPVMVLGLVSITVIFMTSESLAVTRIIDAVNEFTQVVEKPFKSIDIIDEHVVIEHSNYELTLKYEPDNSANIEGITLYKNNTQLTPDKIEGEGAYTLKYSDQLQFNLFNVTDGVSSYLEIDLEGIPWYFTYKEDTFQMVMPNGLAAPVEHISSFGFEGRENFGSERGYIWSRSIPLVFDYWLLGSGPDTFPQVFPQNDLVGKKNAYNKTAIVVDKPHNIYLGYGIQTGLISLIIMLLIWGIYITTTIKLYWKDQFTNFYAKIGISSLVAVIGYLASGVFNDTNINVTPVFWVIMGIGVAANTMYRKELEREAFQNKKARERVKKNKK